MRKKRSRKARQKPSSGEPSPDRSVRSLRSIGSLTTTSVPSLDDGAAAFLTGSKAARQSQRNNSNTNTKATSTSTVWQPVTSSSKTPKISNVTGAQANRPETDTPADAPSLQEAKNEQGGNVQQEGPPNTRTRAAAIVVESRGALSNLVSSVIRNNNKKETNKNKGKGNTNKANEKTQDVTARSSSAPVALARRPSFTPMPTVPQRQKKTKRRQAISFNLLRLGPGAEQPAAPSPPPLPQVPQRQTRPEAGEAVFKIQPLKSTSRRKSDAGGRLKPHDVGSEAKGGANTETEHASTCKEKSAADTVPQPSPFTRDEPVQGATIPTSQVDHSNDKRRFGDDMTNKPSLPHDQKSNKSTPASGEKNKAEVFHTLENSTMLDSTPANVGHGRLSRRLSQISASPETHSSPTEKSPVREAMSEKKPSQVLPRNEIHDDSNQTQNSTMPASSTPEGNSPPISEKENHESHDVQLPGIRTQLNGERPMSQSAPQEPRQRTSRRRPLITRNFVEDYRDSQADNPDVLCKMLNSTRQASTNEVEEGDAINQIGLDIVVNKDREFDEMSDCTNSIASLIAPSLLEEEGEEEEEHDEVYAENSTPIESEPNRGNEVTPGESRRGEREVLDSGDRRHNDNQRESCIESEEGDIGARTGCIESEEGDIGARTENNVVDSAPFETNTPFEQAESTPFHTTTPTLGHAESGAGKRKSDSPPNTSPPRAAKKPCCSIGTAKNTQEREEHVLRNSSVYKTPSIDHANLDHGIPQSALVPSKTLDQADPGPIRQRRSVTTNVARQNNIQYESRSEHGAEVKSNPSRHESRATGNIPESACYGNKRKMQSSLQSGTDGSSKARLDIADGNWYCSRSQETQCRKRTGETHSATNRDVRARQNALCGCNNGCGCFGGPDRGIGKTPPSPRADHEQPVTSSGLRTNDAASAPLWTSELAGLRNTSVIFQLSDGRLFRHPPLPPGWTIDVSKSRQLPYYTHPDYGRSFYPPVLLPSADRSIRTKTIVAPGQWERRELAQSRSSEKRDSLSPKSLPGRLDDSQRPTASLKQSECLHLKHLVGSQNSHGPRANQGAEQENTDAALPKRRSAKSHSPSWIRGTGQDVNTVLQRRRATFDFPEMIRPRLPIETPVVPQRPEQPPSHASPSESQNHRPKDVLSDDKNLRDEEEEDFHDDKEDLCEDRRSTQSSPIDKEKSPFDAQNDDSMEVGVFRSDEHEDESVVREGSRQPGEVAVLLPLCDKDARSATQPEIQSPELKDSPIFDDTDVPLPSPSCSSHSNHDVTKTRPDENATSFSHSRIVGNEQSSGDGVVEEQLANLRQGRTSEDGINAVEAACGQSIQEENIQAVDDESDGFPIPVDDVSHDDELSDSSSVEDQPNFPFPPNKHHDTIAEDQSSTGSFLTLPSLRARFPAKSICKLQNVPALPLASLRKHEKKRKGKGKKTMGKKKRYRRPRIPRNIFVRNESETACVSPPTETDDSSDASS